MVEVLVATVIITLLMLTTSVALSNDLGTVSRAEKVTDAGLFLSSIVEDLGEQSYANLLAMNGNQFFDRNDADDSRFSVQLSVFLTAADLLQVELILTDLETGRELGRAATLRTNR